MFGVNNLVNGISNLPNSAGTFFVGGMALAFAAAIPSMILGALGHILPVIFSIIFTFILPSIILSLAVGIAWKLLSDRRTGKASSTSIKEFMAGLGTFFRSFQSFQRKLPVLVPPTEKDCWDPKNCWTASSAEEISTPIGTQDDGRNAEITLDDAVPHVLLAGRAGSGKSNLLHVIIHGLAHHYSPDELEFYLMDYKDGVEFNSYGGDQASGIQGLPHARLVATESDAEYGITVLEHLQNELLRRNNLLKNSGAKDIKGYRQQVGSLPRILVVIDEFQVLFQTDDTITARVNALLSDLLSRGRSAGMHILLATQSLRALLGVSGFAAVKAKLMCRIALASSREDSEFILESGNYAAANLKVEGKTRYGILNSENGQPTSNIKFLIPFAAPDDCANHQALLAGKTGMPKEIKIFSGAKLPPLPEPTWFQKTQKNTSQVILGEELNFEAAMFSFYWERYTGNNLLIAGHDKIIHEGLVRSLAFNAAYHFYRIVYFNTDRSFSTLDFSYSTLSVKRFDWDGNIADIISDFKSKRTMLIVDSLENAKVFSPPNPYGTPSTPPSPAELFKHFLEEAPQHGSHVVAFAANWKRFESQCRDYLGQFDLRIGFNLDEMSAGSLINTPTGMFKGLDNSAKAVFSNLQSNEQVLFRPFIV